jgi:hypothetical protein
MRHRKLVRWVVGCAVTGVLVAGIVIGGTALASDEPQHEGPAVEQVDPAQAGTLSDQEWT